jgi:LTXXQ motif family protein
MNRIDRITRSALLALVLSAGGFSTAMAQADEHPSEETTTTPSTPGGMQMESDHDEYNGHKMWGGKRMMHGRMGMGDWIGCIPVAHVEGHLAFLKTELGITDAQTSQWNAFADAVRAQSATLRKAHENMMKAERPATMPDRLARMEQMLSTRLDALKAIEAPLRTLYSALSPDQQKKAEELMHHPMGMGMGMERP